MKFTAKITVFLVIFILLTGCAQHRNTLGGAGIGGVAGGIVGSHIGGGLGQTAAIIGGTLAGAALGGYVGSYLDRMDELDRRKLNYTLENNPVGTTSQWNNSDTGNSYSVTPQKTHKDSSGRYCRDYDVVMEDSKETEKASSTACREPDATWEIVSLDNLK